MKGIIIYNSYLKSRELEQEVTGGVDVRDTKELKLALTLLLAILLGLASCCRILQSKELRSLNQFTKTFY